MMLARELTALFHDSVAALSGERLAREALLDSPLAPAPGGRLRVLGLGKAACAMARGAAAALGRVVGVVASNHPGELPPGVALVQGAHPTPDASSERAGRALLAAASEADARDAVLFLVGGGGSAIAAVPADELTLADKAATTRSLLRSGAGIEEVNAVRKHLSALKGGQLAAACAAGRARTLVLCDVPSGSPSAVASGPTAPDPATFADCLDVARRHRIALPAAARRRLERGAAGALAETPKPGDPRLERVGLTLLAAPADLATTALRLAGERGVPGTPPAPAFSGPVERLADELVAAADAAHGACLIARSGEPTVRVPEAAGTGGRMQHLALLLARALAGRRFLALCAGSDGRDGETDHCGALVDGETAARARSAGIDLDAALARFDSAAVCRALGLALPAFASDTNLCDLVLLYLEP